MLGWRNDNELLQLEEEVAGREPGKISYKHSIIFTKTIKSDHDKGRVRHSFHFPSINPNSRLLKT